MTTENEIHSFLFADLVGFTALTAARGDDIAADVAVGFASTVQVLAAEHGVQFVKAMGDAVMVQGSSALETVRLGLRLVHEVLAPASLPPVRIGVHSGPAIGRDGDWYGTTVNVASRLAACARGGELLVTEDTGRSVGAVDAIELVDRGLRRLRDVALPVHIFAASPAAPAAVALRPAIAVAA